MSHYLGTAAPAKGVLTGSLDKDAAPCAPGKAQRATDYDCSVSLRGNCAATISSASPEAVSLTCASASVEQRRLHFFTHAATR
ncbi:hypothetical protein GN956_G10789 [Arapaima gigas]